jgi:MFS transporter, NNP family, nitrate/nitrite transporter
MNTTKPIKGNPNLGLFGATLGFFVGFAAVALFGPTAQKFKDVMGLTPTMVGFLVAMPSLSGSLLRIPFAAWVDTTGGRKPMLTLLGISALGMLGLTIVVFSLYPERMTSNLYPLLLVLGLLSGCGIATFSVGISQASYWFPRHRQGRALAIYGGIGNLAPGLFSFIIPIALTSIGLTGSYLAWLIFLLAGTALYYVYGLNSRYFQYREQGLTAEKARQQALKDGQELFPTGSLKDSLLISARVWKTWVLVAMYFTTFGGFLALTAWFPTYWKSYFAMSAVTAGLLAALYSILTSLIRIVGGNIADRIGGEQTALTALVGMLAGALLMAFSHNLALSIFAAVVMGAGMGIGNAAIFKLVPQEVPQAVGGASGWVGGIGAFGGFVLPPILGAIVATQGDGGYASGFFVFVGLAIAGIGLAFLLRKTHPALVKATEISSYGSEKPGKA